MGLVLLCSLVSSINRLDIVPNFESVRRQSVHCIFTTISFGVSCQVALEGRPSNRSLLSLVSLDPYPHHVLASLQLATDVLLGFLERGEISHDTLESSYRIAFRALEKLPQCLSTVQAEKQILHAKLRQSAPPGMDVRLPSTPRSVGDDIAAFEGSGLGLLIPTLEPSKLDQVGFDCLDSTVFSNPAIILRNPV